VRRSRIIKIYYRVRRGIGKGAVMIVMWGLMRLKVEEMCAGSKILYARWTRDVVSAAESFLPSRMSHSDRKEVGSPLRRVSNRPPISPFKFRGLNSKAQSSTSGITLLKHVLRCLYASCALIKCEDDVLYARLEG
jgi:hypothetical protein